ncbi:replication associated protein [Chifec virus UA13_1727]|uniref:Replication-associated protein n=1 Tax=Chifec virus UA13_1727 TaxID=2914454 RepID=A0AAX3A6M2_9CIRC|nr:replication associated protein [Chifec virus UA13_1727]UNY50594.1 replication associated protein [Chifec virus UA13_1727]
MANGTVRRFCFTLNNYSDEDVEKCKSFITTKCKYGIFGKEVAPTSGTPHLQGFCSLNKPMRFSAIKKSLNNSIHLEKANGSDEQNQKYCSKSGEVFEAGDPCRQGKRTDLETMVASIQAGTKSITEVASKFPTTYIKYYRGIESYLRLVHPITPRKEKTWVYYYWGPTGAGKSRRALKEAEEIAPESIYYKPRGEWWDGYHQQENVIIDDFYGWIKYDELLKICDRYPYKVPVKGGYEEFTTKRIWITSEKDTCDIYHFNGYNPASLERRITCKIDFNTLNK